MADKDRRHEAANMTEHKVMKTIEHIIDESGDYLTHDEVEKLACCWKIIKDIYAGMTYAKQVSA